MSSLQCSTVCTHAYPFAGEAGSLGQDDDGHAAKSRRLSLQPFVTGINAEGTRVRMLCRLSDVFDVLAVSVHLRERSSSWSLTAGKVQCAYKLQHM